MNTDALGRRNKYIKILTNNPKVEKIQTIDPNKTVTTTNNCINSIFVYCMYVYAYPAVNVCINAIEMISLEAYANSGISVYKVE